MKIVVLDGYTVNPGDLTWDNLKQYGTVEIYDRTSPEDVVRRSEGADIVLTNKVVLDETIINSLPELKYIGVLATGYNVIDIEAARKRGVTVTNIPSYSTESVAQMTFALLLNVMNNVAFYANANREGRWSSSKDFCYWDSPLHELSGKKLGIIGLGNIGRKVASIAHMFGMDVFACTSKNPSDLPEGVRKTTLEGLLSVSDIVSLHCPLSANNKEFINSSTLNIMKEGAILINTARGGLINEKDVAEALSSGHLGAYCADVLSCEPPTPDNPLLRLPNAFITPHISWATVEARKRLMAICEKNIEAFIAGNPTNVI